MSGPERSIIIALVGVATAAAVVAFREDVVSLFAIGEPSATATSAPPQAREPGSLPGRVLPLLTGSPPGNESDSEPAASMRAAFDVIRIDPEGTSVFAGRGRPRSALSILANGVSIATVTTSEEGQWAIALDRRFAPGDYEFALTYGAADEAAPSGQRVALHVPAPSAPPLITAASAASPEPLVGAAPSAAPPALPITFVYNEANFTELGRAQAAALAAFFKGRRIGDATLSGHADERGSDLYNYRLSKERLDAVVRFLREAGYSGKLVLLPMGKREPYTGPERQHLSKEEAFALDRRVELRDAH